MQVGISYRCIGSYQDKGFAGNPYETAYRKKYQCLCSLLAGWGAEVPFGGDKVDSKPVVVSSRIALMIANGPSVKGDFRPCKAPRYSIPTHRAIL